MKCQSLFLVIIILCAGVRAQDKPKRTALDSPLSFSVMSIDEQRIDLKERLAGKACLLVNVTASCMWSTELRQLRALQENYGDQGFCILVVPSSDFEDKKPASNAEIAAFYRKHLGDKVVLLQPCPITGKQKSPIYEHLTAGEQQAGLEKEIEGDFVKFLIGRDGKGLTRFAPGVALDAPDFLSAIERAVTPDPDDDPWKALEIGTVTAQADL